MHVFSNMKPDHCLIAPMQLCGMEAWLQCILFIISASWNDSDHKLKWQGKLVCTLSAIHKIRKRLLSLLWARCSGACHAVMWELQRALKTWNPCAVLASWHCAAIHIITMPFLHVSILKKVMWRTDSGTCPTYCTKGWRFSEILSSRATLMQYVFACGTV